MNSYLTLNIFAIFILLVRMSGRIASYEMSHTNSLLNTSNFPKVLQQIIQFNTRVRIENNIHCIINCKSHITESNLRIQRWIMKTSHFDIGLLQNANQTFFHNCTSGLGIHVYENMLYDLQPCALLNWSYFRFRCGTGKLKCHRFLTTFCYI